MSKSTEDLISLLTIQKNMECKDLSKTMRSRTVRRPVIIVEEPTEEERKQEESAVQRIDSLYLKLEQCIQTMPSFLPVVIPNALRQDFILKSAIPDYHQAIEERDRLISTAQKKMRIWHDQSGYHTDLEKLLVHTLNTLTELESKLVFLYPKIKERLNLIAPQSLTPQHLTTAQEQFKNSLECFLLSFCSIDLSDNNCAHTQLCKNQMGAFSKELIGDLYKPEMCLNPDSVKKLDLHLRQHLSLLSIPERIFTGAREQSIKPTEIEPLIKDLIAAQPAHFNAIKAARQLAELYNLIAKIEAYPIHQLIEISTLASSQKAQDREINQRYEMLERALNDIYVALNRELSLFTGYTHRTNSRVKNARTLLHQIELNRNQLSVLMTEFKKEVEQCESLHTPLQRLDHLTSKQQNFLQQLKDMQQQMVTQSEEVQQHIEILQEHYRDCRFDLSHQLQTAITQTRLALQNQTPSLHEEEIAQIEQLLPWINDFANQCDLSSLETRTKYRISQLEKLVRDFKNDLKVYWATVIRAFLAPDMPADLIKQGTELKYTSILLHSYKMTWQNAELNKLNPFKPLLEEFGRLADKQISDLIDEFSFLSQTKEEYLHSWIIAMQQHSEITQLIVSKRTDLLCNAEFIEKRLASKPYLTCVQSMKILEAAFIKIFNANIDFAISQNKNWSQKLSDLKQHPYAVIRRTIMSKESAALLNLVDNRLMLLFHLHTKLGFLNEEYINRNTELCSDEAYAHHLFKIAAEGDELLVAMEKRNNQFVGWVRDTILQPLQQYNPPSCHSLFFAPAKDELTTRLDDHLEAVFMRMARQ
ncbi:hypothetical protein [Legionella shakespearei]|uniref:Uncharacterized protein n=1 Tax=Legionella shakespearei DSM 23087 TaxID=1122169 RepID=A0A0W0YLJ1_9GAMM|nr:hypothetical protein [Legionella shakespearei]KTD57793.1 hypothetical protein Lsha_2268 [Legionella shakespearei DSM 23087]